MNKLIERFGNEKRWVNYKIVTREGKKTKVPFTVTGLPASSVDPDSWSTYDKVSSNCGIMFGPTQKLLGIDIDKCLVNGAIEHSEKENIIELIDKANTYTEISPSGNGLHLFLEIDTPLPLSAHRTANLPYEVYTSGRYFTVTQKPYGIEKSVRTVSKEEAISLLSIIGYPWLKQPQKESYKNTDTPLVLDDQVVLNKMFSSKKGKQLESLYNGDTSNYSGDDSAADLSLCSSLAFWTGRDSVQMERLWMSSPLGSRKKTQDRQDYRTRTINTAIASCKEIYKSPKLKEVKMITDENLDLLYTTNKDGDKKFIVNTENVCRILKKHPTFQGRLRYDDFKDSWEIFSNKTNSWRKIEDSDAIFIQTTLQILFPFLSKVGKELVFDAMIKVAKQNTIDSAKDFITSLHWDGVSRLDTWLCSTYGVNDDVYHRAVGANWLKGLVKRLIEPGCKFDYVLVLEGKQGSKKSTSLSVLGGDWHVETTMSTDSKDFFMQFSGKAIIEFSEGETLSKTEVKKMKAIITTQVDTYRKPFARYSTDNPRRCVFAMTTNQEEYFKDETGNRRWLPVAVVLPEANVEWLQANREQLFAEAYHRVFNLKETIYEFPIEETLAAQEQRQIKSANTDIVVDWYFKMDISKRREGITVSDAYKGAVQTGLSSKVMTRFEEMDIANIFRLTLKLEKKRTMTNGIQCNRWYPSENELDITRTLVLKEEDDFGPYGK